MSNGLPFDAEFQRRIVKMALQDDSFVVMALKYVKPEMFESDVLQWAWRQISAEREAGRVPTPLVLRDKVRKIEKPSQPRYFAVLDAIDQDILREDPHIRHSLTEFVRRNLFVAAYDDSRRVYNMGKPDDAVELMRREMEKIQQVSFDQPNHVFFFADIDRRMQRRRRSANNVFSQTFPTGISGVDAVLDGGLSKGELGVWMGDAKAGKSLLLLHLAVFAARGLGRRVLFVVLEGSSEQTEDRLDAYMADAAYHDAKRGDFQLGRGGDEYRSLRENLVVVGLTKTWTNTVDDIQREMAELKASNGWVPDMIVVDYGDLLRARTPVKSEEEHQREAFADLKSLSTRDGGYAVWTATQARRPEAAKGEKPIDLKDWESKAFLRARDVADSYNKVRRADFIGSINRDETEKAHGFARLYCDMYRAGQAGKIVPIKQSLDSMRFVDVLHLLNRPDAPENVRRDLELSVKTDETKLKVEESDVFQSRV